MGDQGSENARVSAILRMERTFELEMQISQAKQEIAEARKEVEKLEMEMETANAARKRKLEAKIILMKFRIAEKEKALETPKKELWMIWIKQWLVIVGTTCMDLIFTAALYFIVNKLMAFFK